MRPEVDPVTVRIRAVLVARNGADHPLIDEWTARARELHEASQTRTPR